MRQNITLTITSLLTILLMTFHMADDVLYFSEGKSAILTSAAILTVLLFATLVLAGRRSGYALILLGSLVGMLIPIVHTRGPGSVVSAALAQSGSAFLFVWSLIALAVTAAFSAILSAWGLVNSWRRHIH